MRAFVFVLATALAAFGACRYSAVRPEPLAGPSPKGIAIWPSLPPEFAQFEEELFTGLDVAVRSRGYRTTALGVGRELLREAELWMPHSAAPADLAAAGRVLGVDAVLILDVHEFDASPGELRDARWDFAWRLMSTRGGGELWHYTHHGVWSRSAAHRVSAQDRLDAEPEVVPIGGTRLLSFRNTADLAANLHRLAVEHLPRSVK